MPLGEKADLDFQSNAYLIVAEVSSQNLKLNFDMAGLYTDHFDL